MSWKTDGRRSVAVRLFVTVWLLYAAHFASNVVRETYLALALGDHASVRVDEYVGLHPDLFVIPGRGAYINNNPGASILGAVPYALARPALAVLFRLKPGLVAPKPAASYDDPRPNRNKFMNEARARGLDVKLALAALVMQVGLMAPLGALAAVVVFGFLRARLESETLALWLALLYAFGTPIFFRSAFINQNAIVSHCVLFAFVLLAGMRPRAPREPIPTGVLIGAGALLGLAILCDYSGAPMALVFGAWVMYEGWRRGSPAVRGARGALRAGALFAAGAAGPLLVLFGYQWAAFGNPLYPAQRYMPPTRYSVRGNAGMTWPTAEMLGGNLFSLSYGLVPFCPMIVAAVAAPFLRRRPGGPNGSELALLFGVSVALLLFSSANLFSLLQFNTGVRYMVPAATLLFLALVPVLLRLPRWAAWALILPTVVVSWSVSMAREDVPTSLTHVLLGGFELPFLTVLGKTASAYAPFLAKGTSPLPLFCILGVVLWLVWRRPRWQ